MSFWLFLVKGLTLKPVTIFFQFLARSAIRLIVPVTFLIHSLAPD